MTVYVDDMRRSARVGAFSARWSHLFADTSEELMEFAIQIGMKPQWLQYPGTHREHFDLTDARRAHAIRLGATEITYPHGTGELMARKRAAQ